MNKITKFFRDITGRYKTVTRKETRYNALLRIASRSNTGTEVGSWDITATLKDYHKNPDFYEVIDYDSSYVNGLNCPIHKTNNGWKIRVISTYEAEINERVYD